MGGNKAGLLFIFTCFMLLASIGAFYKWLFLKPSNVKKAAGEFSFGCEEDNEGSWSVGVYYGGSPFSLQPIEKVNVWRNESAAWPVANPVLSCASVSRAGFPSNFIADPFLYLQGNTLFLFYETKNPITMHGDIGVAKSIDKGATWQPLGIALDEDWRLSYPYVFNHHGQIYMMPESSKKGELRLYRALNFPLQWTLEKVILKKPFVDSVIINHDGKYWLFGSDHSGFGTRKNGQLEIWYSESPLGPWKPHNDNPIYNTDKSYGVRNGGRPFVFNGSIYRIGQDCGETYGQRVRAFKIEVLTENEYKEFEVPLNLDEPNKGRNSWNGARYHNLDIQRLSSGEWIAVMDGDRVPSGDPVRRYILGCIAFSVVAALVVLNGVLGGVVKCILPLNWRTNSFGRRRNGILDGEGSEEFSGEVGHFCSRLSRVPSFIRGCIKRNTCAEIFVIAVIFAVGIALTCIGISCMYGGSGAENLICGRVTTLSSL